MTEPAAAPGSGSGYQWRIVIDGDPGRRPPHVGCWIDVADGDFQNLNVVGRLEFRAKPCAHDQRLTSGLANGEVWLIGFDGPDLTAAYPSEEEAKAAAMERFADHWTAKGVTETAWKTYKRDEPRRRQHLCGNSHSREPDSNTGWWVQPVPIAAT